MSDISSQAGLGSFRTTDFPAESGIENLVEYAKEHGWVPGPDDRPGVTDRLADARKALELNRIESIALSLERIADTLERIERGRIRGGSL